MKTITLADMKILIIVSKFDSVINTNNNNINNNKYKIYNWI